jgi:RimJ/RimL family protein N-acetyltransferase
MIAPPANALTVDTPRLRLRCLEAKDIQPIVRMIGNWEVSQWLAVPPYPYAIGDGEAYLGFMRRDHAGGHPTHFAIAEATRDRVIGGAAIALRGCGIGEIGYWIGQEHWGLGYAAEAVDALIRHGNAHPDIARLIALADPENLRSHRVLVKSGFRLTGTARRAVPSRRGTRMERRYEWSGTTAISANTASSS